MLKEEVIVKIEQELFELECTCYETGTDLDSDCSNCKVDQRIRELLKILKEDS